MADDLWAQLSEGRYCNCLRSKEMFYDTGVPLEERSGSGIYWCTQTHRCLGPDNGLVGPEDCITSRPCFER